MASQLQLRRQLLLTLILFAAMAASGCSTVRTTGKVIATPVTVTRDVIDAPLVSLTNLSELFANWSNPRSAPQPGVGWSYKGGFNFGIGWNPGYLFFKALSGIFGGLDYLIARSLYPAWPAGISPWIKQGESWWSLYFPNTRALWGDTPPDTYREAQKRKENPPESEPPE